VVERCAAKHAEEKQHRKPWLPSREDETQRRERNQAGCERRALSRNR